MTALSMRSTDHGLIFSNCAFSTPQAVMFLFSLIICLTNELIAKLCVACYSFRTFFLYIVNPLLHLMIYSVINYPTV